MSVFGDLFARVLRLGTTGASKISAGSGTPESALTGAIGDLYLRTNGGAGTSLYVKESGTGTTGWIPYLPLLRATVTLTDAQVKALPTTGITIVSAPGANKVIQPLFINLFGKFTSGAYTNVNAAATLTCNMSSLSPMSSVINDAAITNGSTTRLSDLLGAVAKRAELVPFFDTENTNAKGPLSPINTSANGVNQLLRIIANNGGSGNFTGGNAANTLTVVCTYMIVDVP